MYDIIISLVFLALFAFTVFNYIGAKANGELFFSKFHAVDIATCADVVNAAYGDVVLRYDNIKPALNLGFWFDNGKVSVAKPASGTAEPIDSAKRYYGMAVSYPQGATSIQKPIGTPLTLFLRKQGDAFAISDADTTLSTCAAPSQRAVQAVDARVQLQASPDAQKGFDRILASTVIKRVDANPNIIITITTATGAANTISFQPTSADGAAIACAFTSDLQLTTLLQFDAKQPTVVAGSATTAGQPGQPSGTITLGVTITSTRDVVLRQEDVGVAVARALVDYYK